MLNGGISTPTFPLVKTRPRVGFVDDDARFLEALMLTLAGSDAQFFNSTKAMDVALQQCSKARAEEDQFWQCIGSAPAAEQASKAIDYLANPGRSRIFSIIVADHIMPGERGLEYCARHANEGLIRILLSGRTDSDFVGNAFRLGAIDDFIPKQSRGLRATLEAVLQASQAKLDIRWAAGVRANAHSVEFEVLQDPGVQAELRCLLNRFSVDEYIILAHSPGIAALTTQRQLLWFQIDAEPGLAALNCVFERPKGVSSKYGLFTVNLRLLRLSSGRLSIAVAN
jgi:CheY-like chemotaxis protein